MKHSLLLTGIGMLTLLGAVPAFAQQPYCREYQQTITIEGRTQQGYGTACLQPDGSWKLLPPSDPNEGENVSYVVRQNQVYVMPPEPFVVFEYEGGRHYYPHEYPRLYPHYRHWR